jgi:hypothetical protein
MLAIVSFVLPMGELVIFKRPLTHPNTYMLAEFGLNAYAIYWWYVTDRRERNFRAGTFQNMAVAAFTLVGLPVYFVRSRGWIHGLIATAAALGIFACVVALSYSGQATGRVIAF